jgi:hypothetical protein
MSELKISQSSYLLVQLLEHPLRERERRGLAAAMRKEFSQASSYAGSCELQ